MKKILTLVTLLLFSAGAYATSTPTNDREKLSVEEGTRGEIGSRFQDIDLLIQNEGPAEFGDEIAVTSPSSVNQTERTTTLSSWRSSGMNDHLVRKQHRKHLQRANTNRTKTLKAKRERQKHQRAEKRTVMNIDSGMLGILSFVFGLVGFLVVWFFWPVGLLFAITAIVLGAIGMSGDKRIFALAGLILGVLTIVIPVLLIAVILAAFF